MKTDYGKELGGREKQFLEWVNFFQINPEFNKIESLISLKEAFLQTKRFYQQEYVCALTKQDHSISCDDLAISFVSSLGDYIQEFKRLINNSSYFALIIDQRKKMSTISQEAINGFVTKRINSNISMKVACDPAEWLTYWDMDGHVAEDPHDYTHLSLDSSLTDYIEQKKKTFYKKFSIDE